MNGYRNSENHNNNIRLITQLYWSSFVEAVVVYIVVVVIIVF